MLTIITEIQSLVFTYCKSLTLFLKSILMGIPLLWTFSNQKTCTILI